MDEKERTIKKIQSLRKEINNHITNYIIPKRKELDKLLNNQAKSLCPFCIGDIITLPNNKKGVVKEIKYYSLDYALEENEGNEFTNDLFKVDELEYIYAYKVDNSEFSITWMVSGLRMIKNDSEIGKIPFFDISPINYIIDKKKKVVKEKPLKSYMDISDMTLFDKI